jgi:hypothetical protein
MGEGAKRCRLLVVPAVAVLLLAHVFSVVAAEPFGVRGIGLGILLADFQILPVPDGDRSPGASPVCSNDEPATPLSDAAKNLIAPSDAEAKAGIVRCAYLHSQNGAQVPAPLLIAGVATEASFVFVPDRQGAMRLAGVRAECDSASYERIKAALIKRYRAPQTIVRGFAYDSGGAKLQDELAQWNNGVSQIVLDQRLENENVHHMAVEYRHEALINEAEKRLKAAGGSEADLL